MNQTNHTNQWINYHHLFYFKVIAEEQSVSKAAEKLRLGQPTLSAQLKHLEHSLGVTLFERRHKKLFLTEQGKIALDYARNIFKIGSEMYEVLHDKIKPTRPSLCVASLDDIPKHIVLDLVQAALNISSCQITLLEGKVDELLREMSSYRVDLLVTNFIPTALDTKGLRHRSIAKNKISFYGAPKFKNLKKNFPESLSTHPVLLPTYDSKLRYDLDHWSQMTSVPLDILSESQDIAIKELMAIHGLGLLPAARHTVTHHVESGRLIEIGRLQGVEEELFLVAAQRKIENTIAKELFRSFELKA
ncbi:MAG: LysR family transcriptional regulator [Bdellovibrionaceae bacterium]|nr:LysR family transcriptional regulator [Pseudobdellovibrionaceae bacterium]